LGQRKKKRGGGGPFFGGVPCGKKKKATPAIIGGGKGKKSPLPSPAPPGEKKGVFEIKAQGKGEEGGKTELSITRPKKKKKKGGSDRKCSTRKKGEPAPFGAEGGKGKGQRGI